ncbi:MAG: M48 family metalloprotease [Candidatus Aminicenantes bacterium]|nr:M48 family metalloprotease [Candidatus Aminicenantes bacterium]
MRRRRPILVPLVVVLAVLAATSCAALDTIQQEAGKVETGVTKATSATASATKTARFVRKTFGDISEEEEYYIGRSVAAMILSRYKVYANDALTRYLNGVCAAVAVYSDRPEIFAGYHVLVLDSAEVNALAAPGGFIFLTRGLLKRCQDEDTLADILAHEIGHVCAKHGLQAIKKSRLVDAFRIIGEKAADRYGPSELAQLTDLFEDALADIAEKLIERGYDRKHEYEADELATVYAARMRYDGGGLIDFLGTMVDSDAGGADRGWFATHPKPEDRIKRVQGKVKVFRREKARTNRFKAALAGLK